MAGFQVLVDYTSNLSNLFEDFKKLDEFAQSIENQESENLVEMEDSEK